MHVNGEQLNHNDCRLSLVSFFFLFSFNLSWLHVSAHRRISMCMRKKTETSALCTLQPLEILLVSLMPQWLCLFPSALRVRSESPAKAGSHLERAPSGSPASATTVFRITARKSLGFHVHGLHSSICYIWHANPYTHVSGRGTLRCTRACHCTRRWRESVIQACRPCPDHT